MLQGTKLKFSLAMDKNKKIVNFQYSGLIFWNIEIAISKFTSDVHWNTSFMSPILLNLQFLPILIFLQNVRTLILENPLFVGCFILNLSLICSDVIPYLWLKLTMKQLLQPLWLRHSSPQQFLISSCDCLIFISEISNHCFLYTVNILFYQMWLFYCI